MEALFPTSHYRRVFLNGEAAPLKTPLILFSGEDVHFQLCLDPGSSLLEGSLKLSGGPVARAAEIRKCDYVPGLVDDPYGRDDFYEISPNHLYPDPLTPCDPAHIHGGQGHRQVYFITVHDSEKIPVGEHTLTIRFLKDKEGERARCTVKIQKVAQTLKACPVKSTAWMHYDSFVNQHHVKLWTKDFYRLFQSYLDWARYSGQNMILVPLITPAFDTRIGGERLTAQLLDIEEVAPGRFVFDFEKLRRFITFVRGEGFRYLEMPPFFTQWGALHAPKIMVKKNGRLRRRFGWETDSLSEDYKGFLAQLLPSLMEVLREMGVEEDTFFHVSDEPNKDHVERYLACKALILPHLGRANTLDACGSVEFASKNPKEYVVPAGTHIEQFLAAGVEPRCFYYCCSALDNNQTSRFLSQPLPRTAVLGIQLYQYDIDLFLHWGYNFYNSVLSHRPINPYATTDAEFFPAGDPFIVYPDYPGFGANPSLRLIAMHEAFYLYRLLSTLEEKLGRESVLALLKEWGFLSFFDYPQDPSLYETLPEKILALLEA